MRVFSLIIMCLLELYPIDILSNTGSDIKLSNGEANSQHDKNDLCRHSNDCFTNSLINEKSVYLLQHAHNPVNWYAWNKEALEKAKKENKPIFLSIGYAACHWCHVMEKESFSNLDIAQLLNEKFVSIKVDRELRPDIDAFYGNAVMLMGGQLGWPMSVFLTPDSKPFYAGGYYTKADFEVLLQSISENWDRQEKNLISKADDIVASINANASLTGEALKIDVTQRNQAIKNLLSFVDDYNGGFGEGSKFPRESWLFLLLEHSYDGDYKNESWKALQLTLSKMARGGIYDQLGGGFHRYTIDPYWNVPHFEKMLYNQALLIRLYLRSNAIQPNDQYQNLAIQTLEFLINEMQDPQGGFYSSIDAESEHIEGKYYSWSKEEIDTVLTEEESKIAHEIYDIDKYGDIDNQENVLYIATSVNEYLSNHNISFEKLSDQLTNIRNKLLAVRNNRIKPSIDHKIIMAWNGLAITALAEASMHLNAPKYLASAIKSANFIWNNFQTDNAFYRINYMGVSEVAAQLDDYAYYIQALITLYDIDKDNIWLDRAVVLTNKMISIFWDHKNSGFYNVPIDQKAALPIRPKTAFDKTLPSGNSIAAQMLLRLAIRTGNTEYYQKAKGVLAAFSFSIEEVPSAYSGLLVTSHEIENGEKDLPIYAANGHIRIDALIKQNKPNKFELSLELNIDKKWHVNSNSPLDSSLIPLIISSGDKESIQLNGIVYPAHEIVNLGFSQAPLAIYQGHKLIKAKMIINQDTNPVLKLGLQACNDKICLPPENYTLYPRFIN